eukprot:351970-Chlamydomonas_euryale.AAC.10
MNQGKVTDAHLGGYPAPVDHVSPSSPLRPARADRISSSSGYVHRRPPGLETSRPRWPMQRALPSVTQWVMASLRQQASFEESLLSGPIAARRNS